MRRKKADLNGRLHALDRLDVLAKANRTSPSPQYGVAVTDRTERLAKITATIPVRKRPSKVPAPP
jgi:hypothetical protein